MEILGLLYSMEKFILPPHIVKHREIFGPNYNSLYRQKNWLEITVNCFVGENPFITLSDRTICNFCRNTDTIAEKEKIIRAFDYGHLFNASYVKRLNEGKNSCH
jgi:hypothetical protein